MAYMLLPLLPGLPLPDRLPALRSARRGRWILAVPRLRPSAAWTLTAMVGIAVAATVHVAGLPEAPIALKYSATSAVESARQSGAGELAPVALQSAEESLKAGLRELSNQLARIRWNRDFDRTGVLLESAARRARLAEESSRVSGQESRLRAERLLIRARDGFDQMEWLSAFIPPRSPIRADVSRAKVSYTEARALLDAGRYTRAAAAAQQTTFDLSAAYARFARFVQGSADPARSAQYSRWVNDTIAWSAANNGHAIIVDKLRRTLTLLRDGQRVRTYRAELGINGTLTKVVAGDRATPEGRYRITQKRGPRQTRWYKALMLNYPNEEDLERFRRARRRGQVSHRAGPGSLIEIHGEGGRGGDWTDGCVALVNRDMDDLFERVAVGTPVTIVGFEADDSSSRAGSRLRRAASTAPTTPAGSAASGGR